MIERPVVLSRTLRDAILSHARLEAPLECCGLLLGSEGEVREVVPARNELASATRYQLDPRDHFAAIRRARALGLEVVGAYHSHPDSPPVPSATDLAEAWASFVYVIASLASPGAGQPLRAWCLQSGNFVEVPLVTKAEEANRPSCAPPVPPFPSP